MATINYPSPWLLGFGQGIPRAVEGGLSSYYRAKESGRRTAEDELRNTLLRLQIQEAQRTAAAEEAAPQDIRTALTALQPRTEPMLGQVPPEDVDRTMGLADLQRTVPGAQTLPELGTRMPAESFNRLLTRRPNLITQFGLKKPAEVEAEKRLTQGRAEIAGILAEPPAETAEQKRAQALRLMRAWVSSGMDVKDEGLVKLFIQRGLLGPEAKSQVHFGPEGEVLNAETRPGQLPLITELRPRQPKEDIRLVPGEGGEISAVDMGALRRGTETPEDLAPPSLTGRQPAIQAVAPTLGTGGLIRQVRPPSPEKIQDRALDREIKTLRRDALKEKSGAQDLIEAIEQGKPFDVNKASLIVQRMGEQAAKEEQRSQLEPDADRRQAASDLAETYRDVAERLATALKKRTRNLPGRNPQGERLYAAGPGEEQIRAW